MVTKIITQLNYRRFTVSGAEKFYEVKEVCSSSRMYFIKRYVEGDWRVENN